jgi:hypothetical protein
VVDTTADCGAAPPPPRVPRLPPAPSYERVALTAMLVKKDDAREEFDREKLTRAIRVACAKCPVAPADIERLAGEIESTPADEPQRSSRVVGDMVLKACQLDDLAYPLRDRLPRTDDLAPCEIDRSLER